MSHRVHPTIYRIRELSDWLSRWQNKKNFAKDLEEDFKIRSFLEKQLKDCGLESVEIEKFPKKIKVIINSSRPGLIIGRGGKGVEELKEKIEKQIKNKEKKQIKIEIKEIRDPWIKAALTSQWIASQIERRVSYRKALKQGLDKILAYKEVKGARVEVSGRLDGKEIARREWLRKGRLPRQTIRADIDYGTARARCSYGTVGVKVWVYKGDKF
ncbi:MAG: 30S ribosomal protein S3 [Patescibacteria group bacterium]|nr:30S ribosomal protein S3 [Patescibacteria group bacterium]